MGLSHLIWISASFLPALAAPQAPAVITAQQTVPEHDRAWIDERVEKWQPNAQERAFDQIGWASSLCDAIRLAKQHGRPIFLFTYSGASMACYRC